MNGNMCEITIDYRPKEIIVGQEFEVYGRLTCNNIPVKDADVELYVNYEFRARTETDENGMYSFKLKMNKEGDYVVYVLAYVPVRKPTKKQKIIAEIIKWIPIVASIISAGAAIGVSLKKKKRE